MFRFLIVIGILVYPHLYIQAQAQQSSNVNTYTPPSSDPKFLTVTPSGVFFTANDGIHGRELWVLNDPMDEPRLVKDIVPGPTGSDVDEFMAFGDSVVFRGGTEQKRTVWVSDGTDNGTYELPIDSKWGQPSYQYPMFSIEGRFYFTMQDTFSRHSIWFIDSNKSIPQPLIDSSESGYTLAVVERGFMPMDNYFLFSGLKSGNNVDVRAGLWRSDGSVEGTVELLTILESPKRFYRMGNELLFSCMSSNEFGWELWKSDGTPEGTVMVADIAEGRESSSPGDFFSIEGDEGAYFAAYDPQHGRELWYTDGTTEGTRRVADLFLGVGEGMPYKLISNDTLIFFNCTGEGIGAELWRSDGSEAGTKMIHDIYPGPKSSEPYAFSIHHKGLMFSALNPEVGEELWYTSGEKPLSAGLVADIYPGPGSSFPDYTVSFKGQSIFAATHPLYGRELWRVGSVNEGAQLILDIYDTGGRNPSSSPQEITATNEKLFFTADDVQHGMELWVSDGTPEGTQLVKDIFPGRASADPQELTAFTDGVVYFRANDGTHGVELWKSDGTATGTKMVRDIAITAGESSAPREFVRIDYRMYFVATTAKGGSELWATNGDDAFMVKDIYPGSESSNPHGLVVWRNKLYFRANDGVHGEELWVSNGEVGDTYMVKDIVHLPVEISASSSELVLFKDSLFFALNDGAYGEELYRYKKSTDTVKLFKDIAQY